MVCIALHVDVTHPAFTGPVLTRNVAIAHPHVYPNQHGWPMIPDLEILGLQMRKVLLRRYFAATSSEGPHSNLLLVTY
jgi:hypothetical protein